RRRLVPSRGDVSVLGRGRGLRDVPGGYLLPADDERDFRTFLLHRGEARLERGAFRRAGGVRADGLVRYCGGAAVAVERGAGHGGFLDLGFATLSEKDIQLSADSYDNKTLSTASCQQLALRQRPFLPILALIGNEAVVRQL